MNPVATLDQAFERGGRRAPQDAHSIADVDAWRRELETAAAGGWFHGPLDQHPVEPAPEEYGVPLQATSTVRLGRGSRASMVARSCALSTGAPIVTMESSPVVVEPARQRSAAVVRIMLQGSGWPGLPSTPPTLAASETGATASAALLADRCLRTSVLLPIDATEMTHARKEAPQEPQGSSMRVHVENGPDGVAVWLGLDGDPAAVAARAAAVLAELRRSLQATAQRLALVVCNGTTIHSEPMQARFPFVPVTSTESPWP